MKIFYQLFLRKKRSYGESCEIDYKDYNWFGTLLIILFWILLSPLVLLTCCILIISIIFEFIIMDIWYILYWLGLKDRPTFYEFYFEDLENDLYTGW